MITAKNITKIVKAEVAPRTTYYYRSSLQNAARTHAFSSSLSTSVKAEVSPRTNQVYIFGKNTKRMVSKSISKNKRCDNFKRIAPLTTTAKCSSLRLHPQYVYNPSETTMIRSTHGGGNAACRAKESNINI